MIISMIASRAYFQHTLPANSCTVAVAGTGRGGRGRPPSPGEGAERAAGLGRRGAENGERREKEEEDTWALHVSGCGGERTKAAVEIWRVQIKSLLEETT
jgi:hypothetical protein